MTTINSGNSMAFGCGACAQLKKMSKTAPKPERSYNMIKNVINDTMDLQGFKHGEAASMVYKLAKNDKGVRKDLLLIG